MLAAIYNDPEGGIAVTRLAPVPVDEDTFRPANEDEIRQEMTRIGQPLTAVIDDAIIPSDELGVAYWGALEYTNGEVVYNLDRAVDIKLGYLRKLREDLFKVLDILRFKAMETNNQEELDRVAGIANDLRNMPATALAALKELGDIRSIHAYIPSVFGQLAV